MTVKTIARIQLQNMTFWEKLLYKTDTLWLVFFLFLKYICGNQVIFIGISYLNLKL